MFDRVILAPDVLNRIIRQWDARIAALLRAFPGPG